MKYLVVTLRPCTVVVLTPDLVVLDSYSFCYKPDLHAESMEGESGSDVIFFQVRLLCTCLFLEFAILKLLRLRPLLSRVQANFSGSCFTATFFPRDLTSRLCTSLLLSRLDYCNSLLAGLLNAPCDLFNLLKTRQYASCLKLESRATFAPFHQQLYWRPIKNL